MVNNSEEIKQPDPWNDGPWNEIASLVLFVVGAVILLALVSYSSADNSWNNLSGASKVVNLVGPIGANLADLLYQFFGLSALLLPLAFFALGWWQWNEKRSPLSRPRILGMLMMFIALTGILTIISGNKPPRAFYLGGMVGRLLIHGELTGLAVFLGPVGAVFALVLIFMIGLVIGTRISIVGTFVQLSPLESQVEKLNQIRKIGQIREIGGGFWSRRSPGGLTLSPGTDPALAETHDPARLEEPAPRPRTSASFRAMASVTAPKLPDTIQPNVSAAPLRAEKPARGTARRPAPRTSRVTDPPPWLDEADPAAVDEYAESAAESATPAGGPPQSRSVAEMVANASVVRPDPAEADEAKRPAKPVKVPTRPVSSYKLPATDMLTPPAPRSEMAETELLERARQLAEKCREFNVSGQVMQISPGPVVTTFEFKPDPGVKYSRVTSLVDDLCLGLKAESIRIDRIPGKSTVGIEVPNTNREMIRLREVIESKKFTDNGSHLTFAIGKTIDGSNHAADLAKMPHLLIAGATGAGKSVMLNAILVSLLYKSTPDEVKMILVDPKRLELGLYADIPHLLTPIVTDPKRASYALKWAVSEMENRYKHLALFGVRNIDQYNREVCGTGDRARASRVKDPDAPQPLPFIVVVIDELADLMMVSARDVEESITRLAQMARAVGIHLVLATQRPSVDVITGLIKANFPSRISFRVSSKVDSRTIIDTNGAEQLLGQGDMLFLPPGSSRLIRVHGAYVDEKEVKRICDFVRSQANPTYDDSVVMSDKEADDGTNGNLARDEKYDEALRVVLQSGKASTSLLQRTLRIGYGRAASIIDMMHREGIVGPEDGSKPRQVLVKADFLERLDQLSAEKRL